MAQTTWDLDYEDLLPGMDPMLWLANPATYPDGHSAFVPGGYEPGPGGVAAARVYMAASPEIYGPTRACRFVVGSRPQDLRIGGMPVGSTPSPWPGPGAPTSSGCAELRGSGGIWGNAAAGGGGTQFHATPALVQGDEIVMTIEGWQYGNGTFYINGTPYAVAFGDGGGQGQGSIFYVEYAIGTPEPEPPPPPEPGFPDLPQRADSDCGEGPCGREFTNKTVAWSDNVRSAEGDYVFPEARLAPVENVKVTMPVGRETRDYRATIGSVLWAPLTISVVEWVGQYFNNTRRV